MPYEIPDEEEDMGYAGSGEFPPIAKTLTEKQMHLLLNPEVPRNENLDRYWSFSREAARHLQLTNIPNPFDMRRLEEITTDILRIGAWDADEYFDERQLRFFTRILMLKSAGWTKNNRERDALNESRLTSEMRDNRNPPAKEHGGFLAFLGGKK
jgi:hypothetical protein